MNVTHAEVLCDRLHEDCDSFHALPVRVVAHARLGFDDQLLLWPVGRHGAPVEVELFGGVEQVSVGIAKLGKVGEHPRQDVLNMTIVRREPVELEE